MDAGHGWSDAGRTQTTPITAGPELPVFRLHCDSRLAPPYGGRVLYTQDPGRALITGRCRDIGRFVTQQLRGLAARPPYFVDGSARTLRELVDFYDQRYRIGYSEREKQDLANFLAAL
jgi:cytochrome c peroxidase